MSLVLYTSQQLAAESGASYRQIHYWTEQGFLHPVAIRGAKTSGSGSARVYGPEELAVARGLTLIRFERMAGEFRSAALNPGVAVPVAHGFSVVHSGRGIR